MRLGFLCVFFSSSFYFEEKLQTASNNLTIQPSQLFCKEQPLNISFWLGLGKPTLNGKFHSFYFSGKIMFWINDFNWTDRENREQKSSQNCVSIVFPFALARSTIRPSRLYCAWKSAQKRQICLNFCLERKFIIVSKNMQRKRPPL